MSCRIRVVASATALVLRHVGHLATSSDVNDDGGIGCVRIRFMQ